MNLPPLYAVLDADACDRVGREVMDVAESFLEAGVTCLQVRAKHDSPAGLLEGWRARSGPKAGGPHYLLRFATERTLTVNTAAVGGNAGLLALKE